MFKIPIIMECPVCSKKYSGVEIEEHVEKCLSLENIEKTIETSQSKRIFPFEDSGKDPPQKRTKFGYLSLSEKESNKGKSMATTFLKRDKNEEHLGKSMETQGFPQKKGSHIPLAEKLRPTSLENYIGQKQLLGSKTVLGRLLENREIPSMILWGPPGSGKTSLANVIAKMTKESSRGKMKFVKLSATSSGIADIRNAVSTAAKDLKIGCGTIVFMDEIHRFNKLQQDIFLPHVEAGTFTLIGATTENPSFSLNSALLSRCRVFILEKLDKTDIKLIIEKGIASLSGNVCRTDKFSAKCDTKAFSPNSIETIPQFVIEENAVEWLSEACNGDARVALGGLEIAVKTSGPDSNKILKMPVPHKLSIKDLKAGLEKTHTLSDRKCDLNYHLLSAMQESVRAGNENASLYWLARVMAGGEDPVYIARRLVRVASEDVGLADPEALEMAVHTMHACQMIGMPECDVMLGQCAVYVARAVKSRLVDDALRKAQQTIMEHKGPQPSVPLHIRCRGGEGKLQASLGKGRVNLVRKIEEGRNCLPAGLENVDFFN